VASHNGHRCELIGEEAEAESVDGIFGMRCQRQTETEEGINQPVFCALDGLPLSEPSWVSEIGDHLVVAAGAAVDRSAGIGGDHPVARAEHSVGAEDEPTARMLGRRPNRTVGIERNEVVVVGKIAEPVAAVLAADILEVERVATVVAAEEFHGRPR
jgi:hypothetical protein